MAIAQAQRPLTAKDSLAATQNLLAALVSELCFSRNIFPNSGDAVRACLAVSVPPHHPECGAAWQGQPSCAKSAESFRICEAIHPVSIRCQHLLKIVSVTLRSLPNLMLTHVLV